GKGFGGSDADFGTGQRLDHDFALARDRGRRNIDDRERVLAVLLRVAKRSERVGGLARLRDEDREAALRHRRFAVAEFGGDIEIDGNLREALEPVFRDLSGIVRGAAGGDRDAVQILEVERQLYRQPYAL